MFILKNVKKKIREVAKRLKFMDDFDWSRYHKDKSFMKKSFFIPSSQP